MMRATLAGIEEGAIVMRTLTIVTAVVLASGIVFAHHSFSAYYFEERSVSIEGEVVQFDYSAPHAWVHVTTPDEGRRMQRYAAEWANPARLSRDGITRDTIKPGDRVVITGSPGRNAAENRIHLKQIERPSDGWRWGQRRRR
jgi:hypothetical protein